MPKAAGVFGTGEQYGARGQQWHRAGQGGVEVGQYRIWDPLGASRRCLSVRVSRPSWMCALSADAGRAQGACWSEPRGQRPALAWPWAAAAPRAPVPRQAVTHGNHPAFSSFTHGDPTASAPQAPAPHRGHWGSTAKVRTGRCSLGHSAASSVIGHHSRLSCLILPTLEPSGSRRGARPRFFVFLSKLWQETHYVRFTVFTTINCTVRGCQSHRGAAVPPPVPERGHLPRLSSVPSHMDLPLPRPPPPSPCLWL